MNVEEIRYAVIDRIIEKTETVFEWMDIEFKKEDFVIESSKSTGEEMDVEFYLKHVKNVNRKLWDEVVDFLFDGERNIEFNLLRKRTGHNISFHLKYKL